MGTAHKAFGSKTLVLVHEYMSDHKERTAREIGDELKLPDTQVTGVLRLLEKRHQAYIVGWPSNCQNKPSACWKLGKGKSVDRPKTRKELGDKEWRKLHPVDTPKTDTQPWHETFRPFRDPLIAALFGEYEACPTA